MEFILGLDIGGTHISGALIEKDSGKLVEGSFGSCEVNSEADSADILKTWSLAIKDILGKTGTADLAGIGISMPGPFDYEKGISLIKGLSKYDALYGKDIKKALKKMLNLPEDFPIRFQNDAVCFALGEYYFDKASAYSNILALTIGTGLGAAFLHSGIPVQEGADVPAEGLLYNIPYKEGMAEDYFSARGLLKEYARLSGRNENGVKEICEHALHHEEAACEVFNNFGKQLGSFLSYWLHVFKADCLVLGGNISKASSFFLEAMKSELKKNNLEIDILISTLGEKASVLGAGSLLIEENKKTDCNINFRKTNQYLLPVRKDKADDSRYDIYPTFHLEDEKIYNGIRSLAAYIIVEKTVVIDGYAGIFWDKLRNELEMVLPQNLKINIQNTEDWFLPVNEIEQIVTPYLGEKESVWGTRCDKSLIDLMNKEKIIHCVPDKLSDINIIMGTGAALAAWNAPVIYFDLPKNELQYRMRAKKVTNLGCSIPQGDTEMYKRFYFVDWILLNKHKKSILDRIKIIVDGQRIDGFTWMHFNDLKASFYAMSKKVFRVRPWFEPGAWGGQWIKRNIRGINKHETNYAWSFELIVPENGLILESNGLMLEVSFDFLMFLYNENILGKQFVNRFGDEFPVRFDFLDTVEGGNLSIQCHPSVPYIKKHFGENFTQDETYYILDAEENAGVYLGFQENINPVEFRKVLEQSNEKNIPVNINKYVQYHPAKKHDLFLIPNKTIHSAGAGNLVLEISATPYIFTFKMYDWLRPDLNGKPRPINIEHAFNNLDFTRKGKMVKEELISKPYILSSGNDWKLIHLPTHSEHFYDVHRIEFKNKVEVNTNGSFHVLMLVEGQSVLVETKNGFKQLFHFAETFVIPAATESYSLTNEGKDEAKVVKAFLKA